MANAEAAMLNHILKTGDIVTPLNADVEKSFVLYREEWDFIKDYHVKYREVPTKLVFMQKFDNFDDFDTDGAIEHYIEELHKWKARHTLQEIITGSAANLKGEGPYKTINKMTSALAQLGRDTRMVRDLDLVGNANERLESLRERIELRKSGKTLLGIPSGFPTIDNHMGGWQKGDYILMAAETGQGKSFIAMQMAVNAWLEGYRVMYFSLELSGEQIGYRFDTVLSGTLGDGEMSNSALTHAQDITYDKYKNWLGEVVLDKHPFVVVTNEDLDDVNQNTILAKVEQWKPDLVVLDYLGLFDDASGATGETEKLKNLSKSIKRIAIKTGVPHLVITGITMKDGHGERLPNLHELGWSKQPGYDSDLCVTLLNRGGTIEVGSQKTRRCGDFHLYIKADFDKGIFKELGRYNSVFANKEDDDESEAEV